MPLISGRGSEDERVVWLSKQFAFLVRYVQRTDALSYSANGWNHTKLARSHHSRVILMGAHVRWTDSLSCPASGQRTNGCHSRLAYARAGWKIAHCKWRHRFSLWGIIFRLTPMGVRSFNSPLSRYHYWYSFVCLQSMILIHIKCI